MQAVEVLMQLYGAMSAEEKREVILRIGEDAEATGVLPPAAEAEAEPKPKPRGKRRPFKAWWAKTVEGIDAKARGMFRIEGSWVNDWDEDVSVGQMVVIGAKEPKHYWLVKYTGKSSDQITLESLGKEHVIQGVIPLVHGEKYSSLEREIEDKLHPF